MTLLDEKVQAQTQIAHAFVEARRQDGMITRYPGKLPETLTQAYAIQNYAIEMWDDKIVGWKAGGIAPPKSDELGVDRLIGPVFERALWYDNQEQVDVPVFQNGFAAFEGEVTARIAHDVPDEKTEFSIEDAIGFVASLHIGVEIASSPFAEINDHGPLVTISDFGNNNGLILGEELPNWRRAKVEDWVFETAINGECVGRTAPTAMPGGPIESVRYVLENTARRGHPLKAGMLILTGAVTGVHEGQIGDRAVLSCAGVNSIACRLVAYP